MIRMRSRLMPVMIDLGRRTGYNLPPVAHNYGDSYKIEGYPHTTELSAPHAVCGIGWSDDGGHWLISNLGWYYANRAWFNYDSDDEWYVSRITPGGETTGEDDDAYEDNDTTSEAQELFAGTITGLRCLDTLLMPGDYKASYGDWFKLKVDPGQSIEVGLSFDRAGGSLDLRAYDPNISLEFISHGTAGAKTLTISPTTAGYYYFFVYGVSNAQNTNYNLSLTLPERASGIDHAVGFAKRSRSLLAGLGNQLHARKCLPSGRPGHLDRGAMVGIDH